MPDDAHTPIQDTPAVAATNAIHTDSSQNGTVDPDALANAAAAVVPQENAGFSARPTGQPVAEAIETPPRLPIQDTSPVPEAVASAPPFEEPETTAFPVLETIPEAVSSADAPMEPAGDETPASEATPLSETATSVDNASEASEDTTDPAAKPEGNNGDEKSPLDILEEILAGAEAEKKQADAEADAKQKEEDEFQAQLQQKTAEFQQQADQRLAESAQVVAQAKEQRQQVEQELINQGKMDATDSSQADEFAIHQLEHKDQ